MMFPSCSAQFCDFDKNKERVSIFDTDIYKQDLIGLKYLFESGRLSFTYIDDYHLIYDFKDIFEFYNFLYNSEYQNGQLNF